jgi:hypothetical protein
MATINLAKVFCRCIGKVRRTVKVRKGIKPTAANKEAAAIAICTRSVLGRRGKTLKRFSCGRKQPFLKTQKLLSKNKNTVN